MGLSQESPTKTVGSAVGAQIIIEGRKYVNFGGSSYLGLSSNAEILQAGIEALQEYGSGMPIPWNHRMTTHALEQVESQASEFFGSQAALYLAGGYYFGLTSIAAIRDQFDAIFFDEQSHYALLDGIAASGLRHYAFRHLEVDDCAAQLRRQLKTNERPLIATDGLFSTFGEIAPLDELARIALSYGGRLLIDESHSFGVLGSSGRGAAEHHSIPASSALIGGSLGKAFGVCGGIIPASEREVAAMRSTRVGSGASTGLPAAAAMCARSLEYVREHPELRKRLQANIAYMKKGLRGIGLEVGDNVVPVAAFVTRPESKAQVLKDALMSEGIFVYRSTYIGAGAAGVIRCGIFADHTTEQIDHLLQALRRLL